MSSTTGKEVGTSIMVNGAQPATCPVLTMVARTTPNIMVAPVTSVNLPINPSFRTQKRSVSPRMHSDALPSRRGSQSVTRPTTAWNPVKLHVAQLHTVPETATSLATVTTTGPGPMKQADNRNRVSRHRAHDTPSHHRHAITPYRSPSHNRHPIHEPTPLQRHRRHPPPRQGHRQRRSPSPISRREALRDDPYLEPSRELSDPRIHPSTRSRTSSHELRGR